MTKQLLFQERIKFYADGPGFKNRLFCYSVSGMTSLPQRLLYFAVRYYIRAAWYEAKEGNEVLQNNQIDLHSFFANNEADLLFLPACDCGNHQFINNGGQYICSNCHNKSKTFY
jgi:hypothetical protein